MGVILCPAFNIRAAQTLLSAQSVQSIGEVQTAPPDSIVQLTAEAQGLALVAPADLPKYGTYWLVMPGIGGMAPLPCPPDDPSLPVYQIADGQFLVDATGGQVAVNSRRFGLQATSSTVASVLAAQADAVMNLISQVQAAQFNRELAAVMGFDEELDSPGTFSPMLAVYDTNALWLEIITVTNHTASLVIHPPWNVTNEVYDLLYCTNLVPPIAWQWLLRTDPGQTNLIVPNATDAQGFYRLRSANDSIANSSLGTNFWVTFFNMADNGTPINLSLYISSPVGATGWVTTPGLLGNGPILVVTNCGDTAVNGTYVLTSLTAQEQLDWQTNGFSATAPNYVYGTHWVISGGVGYWVMIDYDSGTHLFTYLYDKSGADLNGNWNYYNDTGSPTPTTLCAQVPLVNQFFTVAAGGVTNISIPRAVMLVDYDMVEANGINITASQPVAVYGLDYDPAVSTAFTAYPTKLLGTIYCVMARDSGTSQLAIVATETNTTVTITPPSTANLGDYTNAFTKVLQQGETYQIQTSGGANDVTGTWITSDQPVGVFAGAYWADVPSGEQTANPLVQEQMPVDSWGTQVLALSFAGRMNGDYYRILMAYSNTVVTVSSMTVSGVVASNLPAGQFLDLLIDGPVEFQASHPIQVAQFACSYSYDAGFKLNPQEGDPCEILLPPIGHCLLTNIVATGPAYIPGNPDLNILPAGFDRNYLNVIVVQSAITNTLVDGSHVAATNFVAIGSSGYYGAQISVTNGTHTVISSQPAEVEVYGFGYCDAYGYFGGVVK
jgi:hypothetical protein